jgi:hypothetical protein
MKAQAAAPLLFPPPLPASGTARRVLVVDDDPATLHLVLEILRSDPALFEPEENRLEPGCPTQTPRPKCRIQCCIAFSLCTPAVFTSLSESSGQKKVDLFISKNSVPHSS